MNTWTGLGGSSIHADNLQSLFPSLTGFTLPSFFLILLLFPPTFSFRSTLSPCVLYFPLPFPRLNKAFPGSLETPLVSSDPFIQHSIIRAIICSIEFLRSHSGNPKRHSFPWRSRGYAFSCPVTFHWYSPPLSFIAYPSDLLSPS